MRGKRPLRAEVARLFERHDVARFDQHARDDVDCLLRTTDDHDVVRATPYRASSTEIFRDGFAQRRVPGRIRAVVEPRAFAAHGRRNAAPPFVEWKVVERRPAIAKIDRPGDARRLETRLASTQRGTVESKKTDRRAFAARSASRTVQRRYLIGKIVADERSRAGSRLQVAFAMELREARDDRRARVNAERCEAKVARRQEVACYRALTRPWTIAERNPS